LWELFAWKPLPQKGDPLERWRKAANPSWQPPSLHCPDLPPEIDDIILKAVRKEPLERYPTATALGLALAEVRRRVAPDADQEALSNLLTTAFEKEKAAEDEALSELQPTTQHRAVTEIDAQLAVVPPTALAFEHRSTAGPPGFDPGEPERATDPGKAPRDDSLSDTEAVSEARVVFLAETRRIEERLVREIEADEDEEYHTSPYDTAGARTRRLLLAVGVGVFVGASALGFLVIWLLGHP
jgi:hypothetical protein